MANKVAESIRRGLKEAVAYAEDAADRSRYRIDIPQQIDVRAIWMKLGIRKRSFPDDLDSASRRYVIGSGSSACPEGPTRACLLVIDRDPKAVHRALRNAA